MEKSKCFFTCEEIDRNSEDFRANSLQSRFGRICANKAYLPFSLGPRNCVGRPLTLLEMRVVLIQLLQKFTFKIPRNDESYNTVPWFQLTLNPMGIKLIPVLLSQYKLLSSLSNIRLRFACTAKSSFLFEVEFI